MAVNKEHWREPKELETNGTTILTTTWAMKKKPNGIYRARWNVSERTPATEAFLERAPVWVTRSRMQPMEMILSAIEAEVNASYHQGESVGGLESQLMETGLTSDEKSARDELGEALYQNVHDEKGNSEANAYATNEKEGLHKATQQMHE
uniref:Uncharacterized protein n=1 Tax=Grammatophora oceanica TaxID=210454 RepID=A0A7S1V0B0_9STRA|mmetsp:Transcript_32187/g.47835  ORF Transcript_32187/g.47835 Transcript_32187/m.47835 type:complete len:150 (+) Transcript_32187:1-450(+)